MAGGRPTKFKPEMVEQAKKLCALGATDAEMADFFKVSIATINLWKAVHPEFSESLTDGKAVADKRVVNALYNRALGYSHEETDIRVIEGKVVVTPFIKHYPPDTTAGIYWTKNRDPRNWRDKRDTEISGSLNLTDMTDDELERAIAAKEAALKGSQD